MNELIRIRAVTPLEGFIARVDFTNGETREINLEPYLKGPIFEPIRNDLAVFRTVKVDPRMKTLVWDNGADIDPDVLYYNLTPAWMEEETTARVA
jgi:hypothetical protein